jgi:signal transduction histidine kinase/pSer/pThr/pTyr-binding forkhead associated (FHA) protein
VARLIVIKGPDEGRQFELELDHTFTIGRDRSNNIILHDTEVSRRHAEIRPKSGGGFIIRDVGSANGTFLNAKPIKEAPLSPGDHLTFGQSILVYSAPRGSNPGSPQTAMVKVVSPKQEAPSSILRSIGEDEGSRILSRPELAGTDWLKGQLANLSVMYETIQAVSHILDLDQLLDKLLELLLSSIPADHGCVMLRNPETQQLDPKAVRYREGLNQTEQMTVSRGIVDHVLQQRHGVLLSDAAKDDRFASSNSITRFKMREVICVPMKGRHEIHGVLFLDTITNAKQLVTSGSTDTAGRFTEDHLALAIAIAHQAALAVEETRYHQALLQAERLAAVGQTIAALSHHIKNIMQGIVFGSDMVRTAMKEKDGPLLEKGWRLVEKNQAKIHELVLDMLSFSKEREPTIEWVDLNSIVEDVVEVLRGRVEDAGVRLEVRPGPGVNRVPADPEGVHRSLLNILTNAVDAVEGRPDPYIGVQTLLEPNNEWARIIILDHGPGIPPEKIADIFRPFVSTKGSKGTGLGLPVSRKIIREHGGDITVESKVGKGSKFVIRIPMRSPYLSDLHQTSEMRSLNTADLERGIDGNELQ